MRCKCGLLLAALVLLALPLSSAQAGPRFGVGIYVGGPYYPYYYNSPYWDGYYYYYRPVAPLYVAPPTVVVQPAPAVQAAPAVETIPAPSITTTPAIPTPAQADVPAPRLETRLDEIDRLIQHLSNPDDKVRADVAIRLGRLKARRAAEPLERVLASDRSADVRDSAARGLGLIGLPASIPALQRAAQSDDDRAVRNSAQFAVEVIRSR